MFKATIVHNYIKRHIQQDYYELNVNIENLYDNMTT